MIVFLDTGVLGKISTPGDKQEILDCKRWLEQLLVRGARIVTSEICEYEVKRGLELNSLECGKRVEGLVKLETIKEEGYIEFLPVDSIVLDTTAHIWANLRHRNIPMTDPKRLDVDAMVCAYWYILQSRQPGRFVVVATENVKDLQRACKAFHWRDIP